MLFTALSTMTLVALFGVERDIDNLRESGGGGGGGAMLRHFTKLMYSITNNHSKYHSLRSPLAVYRLIYTSSCQRSPHACSGRQVLHSRRSRYGTCGLEEGERQRGVEGVVRVGVHQQPIHLPNPPLHSL